MQAITELVSLIQILAGAIRPRLIHIQLIFASRIVALFASNASR